MFMHLHACMHAHHSSLDFVQDGATALYAAAQNGHLRIVEQLIAAKAQLDIQQKVSAERILLSVNSLVSVQNGWTALHIASLTGHCEVIRMLLEANADVYIKTNVSRTVTVAYYEINIYTYIVRELIVT